MTEEQKTAEQLEAENHSSEAEKRIKQLSEKVRLTSEERDEQVKLAKEKDDKIATLERENAFNSGFSDVLGTHQAAKDHKDEIKAKVMTGYSVEDATYAVLGKAGKLGGIPTAPPSPAGGSATNTITSTGQKTTQEMTQAERREALSKDLLWT
jgi:hypothetical protein